MILPFISLAAMAALLLPQLDGDSLPHLILGELHNAALRFLCDATGMHFQGLVQAARFLRKKKVISDELAKKLPQLDITYAWTRHANTARAHNFLQGIRDQFQQHHAAPLLVHLLVTILLI